MNVIGGKNKILEEETSFYRSPQKKGKVVHDQQKAKYIWIKEDIK